VTAILLAAGAALAAFAIHVVFWRLRVPERQTRGLAIVFAVALVIALVAARLVLTGFGLSACLYCAALYGAIALCYMLLYTGIECDSPTLAIAHRMSLAGAEGVSLGELEAFIGTCPFVRARLLHLCRDGLVTADGAQLRLAGKAARVLAFSDAYRRYLGEARSGG
jgi:hypothetical protein